MSNNLNNKNLSITDNNRYIIVENFFFNESVLNNETVKQTAIAILNQAKQNKSIVVDFSKISNPKLLLSLKNVLWGGVCALGGSFVNINKSKNLYAIKLL